jgi:hypothetical protein
MSKITRINKVGMVHACIINKLPKSIREFIDLFSTEFFIYVAKYSQTQIDFHQDPESFIDCLFRYGERQLTAAYFYAFHKMNIICISEFPIKRKNYKIESDVNGRVDYWCFYNNQDYYIESKHSNIGYRKQLNFSSDFIKKHQSDIEKLENSLNFINTDKVSSKDAKLILIHTMSIKMNSIEYSDYNKIDKNSAIKKLINDIKQSAVIEFDHIVGFELMTSITDRVKYTVRDKDYYFPILLIGFKVLNKTK